MSLVLIWIDGSGRRDAVRDRTTELNPVVQALSYFRGFASTLVYPVYVLARTPYVLYGSIEEVSSDRQSLLLQREKLSLENLRLKEEHFRVQYLQAENTRLRQLLGSKAQLPSQATIAEIIGASPDPQRAMVILDKGLLDGIEVGDAVVDAQGLFGQVVEVSRFASWTILVTDKDHAIPGRNNRTGVRMIVGGSGAYDGLVLEDLPASTDLQEGDLIETSGLGGRFPVGYPVGTVSSVEAAGDSPYLQALVQPAAALLKVGHVLVIAQPQANAKDTQSPPEARAKGES